MILLIISTDNIDELVTDIVSKEPLLGPSRTDQVKVLIISMLFIPYIYYICYNTILYSTILYCTVPYCTVQYCTVQYCTVQYCKYVTHLCFFHYTLFICYVELQSKLQSSLSHHFYLFKIIKAHILPLTNVAFNKSGSS